MYIGLNSLGLNTAPFASSPIAQIFQNGEPGAVFIAAKPTADWTTNPDLITMFQDSAGTTPVTALEQPVGLHLDTKPNYFGPNRAASNYATSVSADNTTTATSATAFTQTAGTTAPRTCFTLPTSTTNAWLVTFNVDANTAGGLSLQLRDGAGGGGNILDAKFVGTPTAGTLISAVLRGSGAVVVNWVGVTAGGAFNLSGISIREAVSAPNTVGQPLRSTQIFSDATVTFGTGASRVSPGVYRINSPTGAETADVLTAAGSAVVGAWYEVSFNIDSVTTAGGGLRVVATGSTGIIVPATVGPKKVIGVADLNQIDIKRASGVTDIQISNVSVRLVYGNHRSQATAGARATLSARYNKCLTANANPASVTGSKSGDAAATFTLVDDSTALAAAGLSGICTSGKVYKLDNSAGVGPAYAFPDGATAGNTNRQQISAWMRATGTGGVNTGLCLSVNGNGSTAVTPGNGYIQIKSTGIPDPASKLQFQADAGSVLYFILFDLREACYSYLTTPQITTGTGIGYNDSGFPPRLVYSGAQGYTTGSIDFSASDSAQILASLSKLSDAAGAIVAELGPTSVTSNGSFGLFAPDGAQAAFGGRAMGTTTNSVTSPLSYPSPQAAVLSLQDAINTPVLTLRVNGAQVSSSAGSQGTGNMGNYPMNYGFRNGSTTTNPFTGDEFCSIVRGGATPTTGVIYQIEQAVGRYMGMNV